MSHFLLCTHNAPQFSFFRQPCLSWPLADFSKIVKWFCATISTVLGVDNKLEEIHSRTLTYTKVCWPSLQPRTGSHFSTPVISGDAHQRPVSSVYISHHVCSENHFDQQQIMALCSVHSPRTTSALFSPVLDETTLVTKYAQPRDSPINLSQEYLSHLHWFCNPGTSGSSAPHSRTQPFVLHGCFSDGLGSKLATTTYHGTVVATRATTTHKLAGTGSRPLGNLLLLPALVSTNSPFILRQQHSGGLYSQRRGDAFYISVSQDSQVVSTAEQVHKNSGAYASSGSSQRDRKCTVTTQQPQSHGMTSTAPDLKQSILCLWDFADGHVCNSGKQGDTDLRFTLPGWQGLDGRCSFQIMGWLRPDICNPSRANHSQDSGKDQNISRNESDSHSIAASISAMTPAPATTGCTTTHTNTERGTVPVHSQPSWATISQRPTPIGSGRMAFIRDILRHHNFPESVVNMAADLLRDSSSNVYNSQWKSFASWAMLKELRTKISLP